MQYSHLISDFIHGCLHAFVQAVHSMKDSDVMLKAELDYVNASLVLGNVPRPMAACLVMDPFLHFDLIFYYLLSFES